MTFTFYALTVLLIQDYHVKVLTIAMVVSQSLKEHCACQYTR